MTEPTKSHLSDTDVAALNDQACTNNFGRQGEWDELNEDGKAWARELARLAYERGRADHRADKLTRARHDSPACDYCDLGDETARPFCSMCGRARDPLARKRPGAPQMQWNPILLCYTRDYVAEYAAGVDHIHCRACDRQYPIGMWASGGDGRRRCPSCEEWQWVGPV